MDLSPEATKPTQTTFAEDGGHKTARASRRSPVPLYVLSLLLLGTAVGGIIWHDLSVTYRDALEYLDARISSSAEERVSIATLWLNERRTDTEAVAREALMTHVLSWEAGRGAPTDARLGMERTISRMARINGFLGGAVADTQCRIVVQTGVPAEAIVGIQSACRHAERSGEFRVEVSGVPQGHIWLNLAFPVFAAEGNLAAGQASRRVLGAAIMIAEPWVSVFLPFVSPRNEPMRTYETLIIWDDKGEAFSFSPRLILAGKEAVLQRPLNESTFESRVAREGNVLFGEYTDWRGVRVFGAGRRIGPGQGSLACKVARYEALAQFRQREKLEWLAGALSILLFGFVIVAQHRHVATRDLQEKLRQQKTLLDLKQHIEISEERFRELVENVDAIVWEAEAETLHLTFVSQGAERILGFAPSQWLERPGFRTEHLHPQDGERFLGCERATLANGKPRSVEYRMAGADGRFRWFRDYMHLIKKPAREASLLRGVMVDITEQRKAEEALRESEERFRTLVDNLTIGVYRTTPDGRVLTANPAMVRMLGFNNYQEVAACNLEEVAFEAGYPRRAFRAQVEEEGTVTGVDATWRQRDGSVMFVRESAKAIRGNDGQVLYYDGIVEDITERRRAEEALRASKERYRAFMANSSEGIWRYEADQPVSTSSPIEKQIEHIVKFAYVAECNDALARMMGFERAEEVIGRRLVDRVAEDPRNLDQLRAFIQSGYRLQNAETCSKDREGKIRHFLNSFVGVVEDGYLVRGWGVQRDITEQKQILEALQESEERFRSLSNAALEGIMVHDHGVILDANPAFVRLFGYDQPGELVGKYGVELVIAPESRAAIRERIQKQTRGLLELTCVRKDGTKFVAETDSRSARYLGRDTTIVSCRDITERKRAQEERQRSFDQLRALAARLQSVREEESKRLAREIHDQLGQALTALRFDVTSLISELPGGAEPCLKRAATILTLVDGTIDTVRQISSELRPTVLDYLGLAATVEWAAEEFETHTGIKCRLNLPGEDVAMEPERATAIYRILQELLTNVARHAAATEVEVQLAKEETAVVLIVHDNGKGMNTEKLSTEKSLGILGMQERALAFGGEITIRSSPGAGTSAKVRIPEGPAAN